MGNDPLVICGFEKQSRADFERRFWSKTRRAPGGCLEWTAYRMPNGYGTFAVARCQMRLAHRVAWELTHGPIPEGMDIMHHCDNPGCVEPSHLALGTAKENTHDMLSKGRHAHGERHPKTTLTDEQVLELRSIRERTNMSYRKLGALFGIGSEAAWKIVKRTRWTHI